MEYAIIQNGIVINKIKASPEFIKEYIKSIEGGFFMVAEDCEFDVGEFFVEDKLIKRDLMEAHKKYMMFNQVSYFAIIEDGKPKILEVKAGERVSGGIRLPAGWTKSDIDLLKVEDGRMFLDHGAKLKRDDKDIERIRKEIRDHEWNEKPIMARIKDSYFGSDT